MNRPVQERTKHQLRFRNAVCVCVREIDFTEFHLSALIMFLVLLLDLTINERPPSPL